MYCRQFIITFTSLMLITSSQVILRSPPSLKKTDTVHKDSITQIVRQLAAGFVKNKHVSLSIGVINRGKTQIFSFGAMDLAGTRPTLPNTIYEIASVTKTFTGILLAHALIEKKIFLDDNVCKYLPQLGNLAYSGIAVSIRNLASHTAGLPKFVPDMPKGLSPAQIMDKYDHFTESQFLSLMQKVKLDAIPGSKFNYSNADAQLIGIILEKVYHLGYSELLKKYITDPLHMRDTKLSISRPNQTRFPDGYNPAGDAMPRLTWWRQLPAAGYLKSTTSDMLKYLQLNLNGKDLTIKLAHQSIYQIDEEGADGIGLFWFNKTIGNGLKEIYHAGGSFGSTSYCALCSDRKTGVVILCNNSGPDIERLFKTMGDVIMRQLVLHRTSY
jgi:D-alanyl-D-alanine-carboxypeptidase/D-alanyl-D-alanine-endopeptidase